MRLFIGVVAVSGLLFAAAFLGSGPGLPERQATATMGGDPPPCVWSCEEYRFWHMAANENHDYPEDVKAGYDGNVRNITGKVHMASQTAQYALNIWPTDPDPGCLKIPPPPASPYVNQTAGGGLGTVVKSTTLNYCGAP